MYWLTIGLLLAYYWHTIGLLLAYLTLTHSKSQDRNHVTISTANMLQLVKDDKDYHKVKSHVWASDLHLTLTHSKS